MNYICCAAWGVDFIRAMIERPLWAKILFRLSMGKYAYREFIGLMDALEVEGMVPYLAGYGLENQEYHKDKLPFRWWIEREPIPKKQVIRHEA